MPQSNCVICSLKSTIYFFRFVGATSIPFECPHVKNSKSYRVLVRFQQLIALFSTTLILTIAIYDLLKYTSDKQEKPSTETIKKITFFLYEIKTCSIIIFAIYRKRTLTENLRGFLRLTRMKISKSKVSQVNLSEKSFKIPLTTFGTDIFEIPSKLNEIPAKTLEIPVKTLEMPVKTLEIPIKTFDIPGKTFETPSKLLETSTKTFEIPVCTLIILNRQSNINVCLGTFLLLAFVCNITFNNHYSAGLNVNINCVYYNIAVDYIKLYCFYLDLSCLLLAWINYTLYSTFLYALKDDIKNYLYAKLHSIRIENKADDLALYLRVYIGIIRNFSNVIIFHREVIITWLLLVIIFTVLSLCLIIDGLVNNKFGVVLFDLSYLTLLVSLVIGVWMEKLMNAVSDYVFRIRFEKSLIQFD